MALIIRNYSFSDNTAAYGSQVDSEIGNLVNSLNNLNSAGTTWTTVKVTTLTPMGDVSMGGHKITSLATPTVSGDMVRYPFSTSSYSSSVSGGTVGSSGNQVTITTSGGPVLVWWTVMVATNGGGITELATNINIDGTTIGEYWQQSLQTLSAGKFLTVRGHYYHTPTAGSHTYLVKYGATNSQGTVYNNVLALELKA